MIDSGELADRPGAPDRRSAGRLPGRLAGWWDGLDASGMRVFWVVATVLAVVQLAALAAYSGYLYHRFDLTDDFGTYGQAWWLIGHGHLNPVDTIQTPSYPFVQSHAELAMWPVALVGRLWPHPIQLLWLQDLAMVATEWIAAAWVARVCAERMARRRSLVAIAALVLLMANPWWYQAASFDVHFELLGLPFVVWSACSLWRGRTRTCLAAAAVAVLFGDVVALSVLCVGIAGLLARRVRRRPGVKVPLTLVVGSLAWLVVVTLVGADKGSGLVTNYGYLVGAPGSASSTWVVTHLATHPWHAVQTLFDRRAGLGRVVASAGVLGVVTPWGLAMAVGTLGPAALNANRAFLSPTIAFQTIAVIPFVLVGTVMVLVRIGARPRPRSGQGRSPAHLHSPSSPQRPERPGHGAVRSRAVVASALAVGLATLALVQSVPLYQSLGTDWWRVDAPAAAALRSVLPGIPADAQVIASQGVIGRFAERQHVYPLLAEPQAFPVRDREVVFVIVPSQGIEPIPPAAARADAAYVRERLGATTVLDRDGVVVLAWRPPPGVTSVVLP